MMSTPLHFLIDFYDCDGEVLDNLKAIEAALVATAEAIGSQIVAQAFHRFTPQGIAGFLVVGESHFTIRTWPESGFAVMDIFSCGAFDPRPVLKPVLKMLESHLKADRSETLLVRRGEEEDPDEDEPDADWID